jgi:nucleotide-binding universal stress UspA family protein
MGIILVATDGSVPATAAVSTALDLAAAEDAEVVFTAVWRHPSATFTPRDEFAEELDLVEHDLARGVVGDALRRARVAGVRATAILREGEATDEICTLANELEAQLIVIGSHGYGGLVEATLGSVSQAVLRQSTVPVLVVPTQAAQRAS